MKGASGCARGRKGRCRDEPRVGVFGTHNRIGKNPMTFPRLLYIAHPHVERLVPAPSPTLPSSPTGAPLQRPRESWGHAHHTKTFKMSLCISMSAMSIATPVQVRSAPPPRAHTGRVPCAFLPPSTTDGVAGSIRAGSRPPRTRADRAPSSAETASRPSASRDGHRRERFAPRSRPGRRSFASSRRVAGARRDRLFRVRSYVARGLIHASLFR